MSDALLIVSFGGPEGPDDVEPFLRNVTRGRAIPAERLAAVAKQYLRFGGVSPLNRHCRDLKEAVEAGLANLGDDLPVYWGNRNWHPYLSEAVEQLRLDGITRVLAFITSPYSSFSSCRQYLDELEELGCPRVVRLGPYFDDPGFIEPMAENLRATIAATGGREALLLFSAHSLPRSMASACDYEHQVVSASRMVAERAGARGFRVVWQSRSGPPAVPWLEPDISTAIHEAAGSAKHVIAVPIGFISDHMEVIYDLDVSARETAEGLGVGFDRVATVGIDHRFVRMICRLASVARARPDAPSVPAREDRSSPYCSPACCPAGIHQ